MTDNIADKARAYLATSKAATPKPWARGWWSAQAEAHCDCSTKGELLGKRPQSQYPGAGPFHIHERDWFRDDSAISGQPPACAHVISDDHIADCDANLIVLGRNHGDEIAEALLVAVEALERYGWHKGPCANQRIQNDNRPCICGFQDTLHKLGIEVGDD